MTAGAWSHPLFTTRVNVDFRRSLLRGVAKTKVGAEPVNHGEPGQGNRFSLRRGGPPARETADATFETLVQLVSTIALGGALLGSPAVAATQTFSSRADGFVDASRPSANYGSRRQARAQHSPGRRRERSSRRSASSTARPSSRVQARPATHRSPWGRTPSR